MRSRSIRRSQLVFKGERSVPVCFQVLQMRSSCSPVSLSFLPELRASQAFEHYSLSEKPMDYRILLVDEDQDRMYVGCKDHVLSMDINNITQGLLKVRGV